MPHRSRFHRTEGGDFITHPLLFFVLSAIFSFLKSLPSQSLLSISLCSRELGFRLSPFHSLWTAPLLRSRSSSAMASISVPCPKCSVVAPHAAWRRNPQQPPIPMVSPLKPGTPLVAGSARFPLLKGSNRSHSHVLKAQVQEVAVDGSSSSSTVTSTKSGNSSSKDKEADALKESASQTAAPDSMISAYIAEASNLVKLVDSKDITELQLKRKDFELIIRKKTALPQPAPVHPPVMMQPPLAVLPPQSPFSHAISPPTAASPSPAAPAPALPPATKGGSNSSLPPFKCPMAGTFYRCPGPGEPPFVKAGDKVQKGQVVCIIEAMKLMNEIEADQSGTVVEILAEDGKPVSVDTPLLIIQP